MLHSTTSSSMLSFMLPHQVSEDPSAIQPFSDITLQHHMLLHIRYSNIHFHRVTHYSSTHFSRLIQPFIVIHTAILLQLVTWSLMCLMGMTQPSSHSPKSCFRLQWATLWCPLGISTSLDILSPLPTELVPFAALTMMSLGMCLSPRQDFIVLSTLVGMTAWTRSRLLLSWSFIIEWCWKTYFVTTIL